MEIIVYSWGGGGGGGGGSAPGGPHAGLMNLVIWECKQV